MTYSVVLSLLLALIGIVMWIEGGPHPRTWAARLLLVVVLLIAALPDGALLMDGGLTGRAPVLEALAAEAGVERAVVVMSYAPDEPGNPPTTMRRAVEEAFEMGMIHQIQRDVELARLKFPAVELHVLTPSAPLGLRPLDFEPTAIARALERGRADAAACLSGWVTR